MESDEIMDTPSICAETDRAHLTINLKCNNNCLFCLQGHRRGGHKEFLEVCKNIDKAANNGVTKIILSGGEPTIHPDYLKIVKYCSSKNFKYIQTITNGRMFSLPKFVDLAVESGLNEVTLSIHGADDETHDYLVGVSGALNQIRKSIDNFRKHDILISVDIGIFRQNYFQLPKIVTLVHDELGLKGDINIMGPTFQGSAEDNDVMPLYKDVEPFLIDALRICSHKNIVCWVLRVPLKYMGPFGVYKQDNQKLVEQSVPMAKDLKKFPSDCKGEKCNYCRMMYVCDKVELLYPYVCGASIKKINLRLDNSDAKLIHSQLKVSKFLLDTIYMKNPTPEMISSFMDTGVEFQKLVIENPWDNSQSIYDVLQTLDPDKLSQIRFSFDFLNFNETQSKLLNIPLSKIDSIVSLFSEFKSEFKIIITKKNTNQLGLIAETVISRFNPNSISFDFINPFEFIDREISWVKGLKLHDTNNLIPNMKYLEPFLGTAIKQSRKANMDFNFRNLPPCLFSEEFVSENESFFLGDDIFNTIFIDSFDKLGNFSFSKYVRRIYNTSYKERIKSCDKCKYNFFCAGFYDMYLKLYTI